ncbi:Ca(2+)/Mn(2+)-transporting P-type ATPase [Saccharomycopsis crataegensis]|uniref:Calcium-transporting ATPase n=1 Tax=Saccharomycopsis crataegensis TaxID=43959 RepID=A0AAV5QTC9_9ASCO|nr:Ca(2+)/Mn(2+)-transporting P-type ATPase [Saccharomycopsis crataegensis]
MSDNPFETPISKGEDTAVSSATNDAVAYEYCLKSVEETAEKLSTDVKVGLSSPQDISYRKRMYGLNEMEAEEDEPLYLKFVKQFYEDPLILLLIGSAIISFLMGNIDDAVSITVAITIVVTVGFVQEYRSEKSLEALNKLVPPNCHLTRNGSTETLLASNLVPGDLVHFNVGDRIPADVRIIESNDLSIDESNLTGETNPISKNALTIPAQSEFTKIHISDCKNIGFMGTLVRDGNGSGIVVSTGSQTVFGHIFKMMADIEKPKTPLQLTMDKLGKQLSMISFGIIAVIGLIGIIEGKSWLDMFQISVSLAVAAIPEGLPIIVTVTLALGVLRMASHQVIVRRLPSVETLGSVNVLCTDKTGTLTQNHMTVTKIWAPQQDMIDISAEGTHHGSHHYGYDEPSFEKFLTADVQQVLEIGNICNNSRYSSENDRYIGNPTDVALVEVLRKFKLEDIRDTRKREKELSFNSARKYMAVTVHKGDKSKNETYIKGAYEKILNYSTHVISDNKAGKVSITEEFKQKVISKALEMASHGLRVIALAKKEGEMDFNKDPSGLKFGGLIGMYDPPRPNVPNAIAQFARGGVHVIMITGDSEGTAVSIAKQVGLYIQDASRQVISGEQLDNMSDRDLSNAIQYVNVFARSTPSHKVRIVKALQNRGDVVAMTGDGVNDAPALKLADIGISMGKHGTDVAKEASDMILVNDDFTSILTAIEEGKGIFYNIQNFLCFQLSTSVGALGLIAITTFLNLPNPLNPMMILFINIIMDGPPAQSLGVEAVDQDIMNHPPRSKHENILSKRLLQRISLKGLITVLGTIFIYSKEITSDHQVTRRDTTMTFVTFVSFDMWNAISCKHNFRSIFQVGFFKNKFFNIALGIIILAELSIVYIPLFQNIFQTEGLSFGDLVFILFVTSSVFVADEVFKMMVPNNNDITFAGKANAIV